MKRPNDIPEVYYDGRECRQHGGGKLACPFSPISVKGAWWKAGWHDMDMELPEEQARRLQPPDAPDFKVSPKLAR